MKQNLLVTIICIAMATYKSYGHVNIDSSKTNITAMKQFSLLIRVPETYGSDKAKMLSPQWDKLLTDWKESGVYVVSFAFPGESYTVNGTEKTVKKEIVLSNNLKVVSNIVIQTESMEKALEFAKHCPILKHEGTVEVREIPNQIRQLY